MSSIGRCTSSALQMLRSRHGRLWPLAVFAFVLLWPAARAGAAECGTAPNPIVCENALPGDPPSDWQVRGAGDPTIQGFATSQSVNAGQTISFKINTPASSYHIDILRLGYYGGNGARIVASHIKPSAPLPQSQPACLTESATGLIDCGNWGVSASWTVPAGAVSGLYIAHLVRDDTGGESQIFFVVRNDSSHSEILLQTSDATWEAYNDYGGNSLYTCTVACPTGSPKAYKAAYAVSYNRPFDGALTTDSGASDPYYAEYQLIRFLEENGYNVSYTSEAEVARNGSLLKNHKLFVSSGHDEYWSGAQRANVEAAREAGVNLAFFSGNELFWKTRWAASIDGSNTSYRTLVSYKETHFEGPTDPQDPSVWTGAWRDPRASPPADGGRPENALTGQQFTVNSGTSDITVPSQYSRLRLWRNTAVASLQAGQTLTLSPETGTLGYEWDEDVDNGFRPAGEFDLSSTTVSGLQAFTDYGSSLNGNATATHHLTLYRAPSGALVFGAGTVQWSWGLDNTNAWEIGITDPSHKPPDPNMEQATVNLLADMGAQPGSLLTGLQTASKSSDTTPPTSTITSPAQGETLQDGNAVTITGTATDAGGGVVAGVEVSTDGGSTWHPATLTTPAEASVTWSYRWAAHGNPTATILSRAVDDSANLETPSAGTVVKVLCPCSIWGAGVTPPTPDAGDPHSAELGVKFTTEVFGTVTGLRFYKSEANTGTHVGSLWSASGQRLASATFTSETESGWQQVTFSTPVDVFPSTTYIASYFDPNGHYSASPYYFYTPPPTGGNALNSPPLHAVPAGSMVANGAYTSANGVFSYSPSSTFPASSFNGTNYWVDPVFVPAGPPGQVTGVSATAGSQAASLSWNAPSEGGPVTTYTITPYIGSEAQPATTITGTPPVTSATITGLTSGTTYTFRVQASNPSGQGPPSAPSNPVTPSTIAPPSAPTEVTASAASAQALVGWNVPTSNGGSPITGYKVTAYIGAAAQSTVEVGSGSTSTIVKGLSNGASYTFTVSASNAVGTGAASAPSRTVVPQDTIFDFATPTTIDSADTHSVEVGVKFSSEVAGSITGIRFYKASTNTGTHTGSLWSASGTLLASATFSGESTSGWQQVSFSSPVAITPNTTYVAGYLAPKGHYSDNPSAFASAGAVNPPLSALANTASVNGVYAYSATSTFPTSTFKATNYWVDVDFIPVAVPGQVTNVSATAGSGAATVSWSAPTEGGPVSTYTVTPYIGTTAQTPTILNGTPPATGVTVKGLTSGTTYTFKVQASNSNGSGPISAASNPVTPTSSTIPGQVTGVSATAGPVSANVSWSEPAEGGPVSTYTVTPYIGTTAQTPTILNGTPPATGVTVKGLT
ncbi:MAG TPA: N,N-dimethylformamidase beta subunit family domain-containing protein, partial [Solirubrobacteraceae bacterium]|nr:N,N-dimethylformamidase beta subunit family domain-containing protein [Solirubrobacteraceae bacterium]